MKMRSSLLQRLSQSFRWLFAAALIAPVAIVEGLEPQVMRGEVVGRTDATHDDNDEEDRGSIYGLIFSPDGRSLVGGDHNGAYRWNLEGRQARIKFEGTRSSASMAFSSDSRTLYYWTFAEAQLTSDGLVSSVSPLTLSRFSVATGKLLQRQEFPYPPKNASDVLGTYFFPASNEMVVGFETSKHNVETTTLNYTNLMVRHNVADDKMVGEPTEMNGPFVVFHVDGKLCSIVNELAPDEKAISYSVRNLQKNATAVELGVVDFDDGLFGFNSLSACGEFFTVHTEHFGKRNEEWGRYQTWAVGTGKKVGDFTVERNDIKFNLRALCHLLATSHGLRLAMLDENGVPAWDVSTGKEDKLFRLEHKGVTSIAVSPDGGTICTGGNHEVRRWQLPMPLLVAPRAP